MVAILVAIAVFDSRLRTCPASEESTESGAQSILTPRTISDFANNKTDPLMDGPKTYTATRAGISEAIRTGNLAAVKRILTKKPELLHSENPYNWANLEEMRVWPWASKPAELAVVFGHTEILEYLLSISETEENLAGWKPQPRGDGFQPSRYFP